MPKRKTKVRNELFAREWLANGMNGRAAALATGIRPNIADRWAYIALKRPAVIALIETLTEERAQRLNVNADRIVEELALCGFANIKDLMSLDANGQPVVDLKNLTRDQAAAIAEITTDSYAVGKGENIRVVVSCKVKMHAKLDALEKLGKHVGLYPKDEPGDREVKVIIERVGG